jgi:hypothetical protein
VTFPYISDYQILFGISFPIFHSVFASKVCILILSCFLMQSHGLCELFGELSPFAIGRVIEKYVLILILLLVSFF